MKYWFIVCLSFGFCGMAQAAPATVKLKGSFDFLSDAPMEKIEGLAKGQGELVVDMDNLSQMTGTITVPVASMETGNATRDEHLRSADWLNAAAHPNITFVIESAEVISEKRKGPLGIYELRVKGTFTLHGVSQPLEATATMKNKQNKYKVSASFQIALADYKVTGASGIVGSKVGKTIDIKVQLKGKS